jgi:hypothetical protein
MLFQKLTASLSNKLKQGKLSKNQIIDINYDGKFVRARILQSLLLNDDSCVHVRPRVAQNFAIKVIELME